MKVKELESRLELEQATRSRIEVQFNRYKDALDKSQQETSQTKAKELIAQDSLKKSQKSLRFATYYCSRNKLTVLLKTSANYYYYLYLLNRELREEYNQLLNRENDSAVKRKDLEQKCATAETEMSSLKNDLRLALQRIADLQQALEEDADNDDGSSDR